ncbi:MAG: GNAT family N-acetyltransferase [Gemmatimonadota bacterium]
MLVRVHPEATSFLAAAGPDLEAAEALNSLMLGIAGRLARIAREGAPDLHGEAGAPPVLVTVEAGDRLTLAALRTPPRHLILYGGRGWEDGLETLVGHLERTDRHLPGALGPRPVVQAFAGRWSQRCRLRVEPGMQMGVYELRQVLDAGTASGRLRPGTAADVDLLGDWLLDFNRTVHEPMPGGPEEVLRTARELAAAGCFFLWEDGGHPVSMARCGRPTAHGVTVTAVYTPPRCRRRGYATACVAALTRLLLNRGATFTALFTDLANPTSNHIYQQVGYRLVGEFAQRDFHP